MNIAQDHVFLSSARDIAEITKPLEKFNINYFTYTRTYLDGKRLYLTNHIGSLQNYFANKYYLVGNCEGRPNHYQSEILLWSGLPKQFIYQDAKDKFGIDHGAFIIEKQKNYVEFFGIATTSDRREIINFYLNNIEFLKTYCLIFKDKAKDIIEKAEQKMVILPYHNHIIQHHKIHDLSLLNPNLNTPFKLSNRQHACVIHLIQGDTAKQIAMKLNLSPRTVEAYIQHVKNKLKCRNKSELIAKLLYFFQ